MLRVILKNSAEEKQEEFKSKKQQGFFYAQSEKGSPEHKKKWKKMAKEFSGKTDFEKLPEKKEESALRSVKVTLENGKSFVTSINGTDEEIKNYYLHKIINLGIEDDDLQKVERVDILED